MGEEGVRAGIPRSYYSMGVGAVQMAESYGLRGNKALCSRWAKKSVQTWECFFRVDSKWFNSYLFYAKALGLLGQTSRMDAALAKAKRIAGPSLSLNACEAVRSEVRRIAIALSV